MRVLLAALSLFAFAKTAPQADSRAATRQGYTTATVYLRAGPTVEAAIRAKLPAATPVRIGTCYEDRWCPVQFRRLNGYVYERYLSDHPSLEPPELCRGYTNSRGIWVPSPTRTRNGAPPPGASAQCADGTFSFSMSRSGTCSHHGGVVRWL